MFKRIPRRCNWFAEHEPHETPTGFFDTATCDGVALLDLVVWRPSIWDAMKNNELRKLYGLDPLPHKHMLRLTKVLVTPKGVQLYPNSLGWICDCGYNYAMDREIAKRMLMGEQIQLYSNNYKASHWE